jgi:tetratricopeptide (TPR) repeat protein
VTDNSIVQAVRGLRVALGTQPDGNPYIETLVRKGYRFVAPIERSTPRPPTPTTVPLEALLEPYRAFVDARAAIETLDRSAVDHARQAFADALRIEPAFAAAHIGMANACLLRYETSRADGAPDPAALSPADLHARESCRLAPSNGDAWSTLALVRYLCGDTREAIAAARKAVTLEPDAWCHYLRLAFVSWGEERLRAARRALSLCPDLALSHWFAATVFVARETFDRALDELRQGCAAQDRQSRETSRFPAIGLHLLRGLVLAATRPPGAPEGDEDALAEFARELAAGDAGHVYARQSTANSWYATGAVELHRGRIDTAHTAFREAMACVPGHALATVGLRTASIDHGDAHIDAAIVTAAALAIEHKHHEAAQVCAMALERTPPGAEGWPLPVEPLLRPTVHRQAGNEAWAATLAALHARAM